MSGPGFPDPADTFRVEAADVLNEVEQALLDLTQNPHDKDLVDAVFGQTGPIVGSFDGGFGSSYLARLVGQKRARETWYLCHQYSAAEAFEMGMVNKVVPLEQLEDEGWTWAQEILEKSPLAIRLLKSAFNADLDGQAGIQELAGNATLLFYMTEQGQEGRKAYVEKRKPEFRKYPWLPW